MTALGRIRRASVIGGGVLALGAVLLPLVFNGAYIANLLVLLCLYITLSVSYNLIVGFTGYLTLAHTTFFGIGVYASAISTVSYGQPAIVGIGAGAIVSAVVSFALGLLLFVRLRGFTFSIVTLGLAVTAYVLCNSWIGFTNGPLGISGVLAPTVHIGPLDLGLLQPLNYYYVGLMLVAVTLLVHVWVASSRPGRALVAIRENERLAEAYGVNTLKYKLLVFVLGSALASLAGSYYVHYVSVASPDVFWTYWLTGLLAMLIVGGPSARARGVVLATGVLVILPQVLTFAQSSRLLIYGVALLLIVVLLPQGIGGALEDFLYRRRLRAFQHVT